MQSFAPYRFPSSPCSTPSLKEGEGEGKAEISRCTQSYFKRNALVNDISRVKRYDIEWAGAGREGLKREGVAAASCSTYIGASKGGKCMQHPSFCAYVNCECIVSRLTSFFLYRAELSNLIIPFHIVSLPLSISQYNDIAPLEMLMGRCGRELSFALLIKRNLGPALPFSPCLASGSIKSRGRPPLSPKGPIVSASEALPIHSQPFRGVTSRIESRDR